MTTREHSAACAAASARSSVTTTPLPAASPSSLTTYGGPNSSSAAATSSASVQTKARPVGTPAAAMTCLAKAFDPSSWAAAREGPKQAIPRARTASATPATSGASGPTTTRSTPSRTARSATADPSIGSTSCRSATVAIPGLPGAAWTSETPGSRASARASACSRPPVPMTSVFTAGLRSGRGGRCSPRAKDRHRRQRCGHPTSLPPPRRRPGRWRGGRRTCALR